MTVAALAMLAWPLVTIALFATQRPRVAAVAGILGGGLLLPERYAFDTKGLPGLDREAIAALSVLAGCLLFARRSLATRIPRGPEWLVVGMFAAGFLTVLTNGDPRPVPGRTLPALSVWDAVSYVSDVLLVFGLPFYLGRTLFRRPGDLQVLLVALVVAGLVYSLPILWEVRMSPHLHYRLYGFQPADFAQAKRESALFGWRPMVFVGHGLTLAMFVATTCVAAAGLQRVRPGWLGRSVRAVPLYLYGVLVVCNAMAATVYGTVAAPLVGLARRRTQVLALSGLALLILAYPALRLADLFPTRQLVEAAEIASEARASSLAFRFENEDLLLEHARERVLFGWGGFGRERVYDQHGRSASVSDGYWIIVFGQNGVVGFVLAFGLLLAPVFLAVREARRRRVSSEVFLLLTVAWVVALNVVDLLPNGFLNARTVFLSGALAGATRGWRRAAPRRTPERARPAPRWEAPPEPGPPRTLGKGLRRRALGGRAAQTPPGGERERRASPTRT